MFLGQLARVLEQCVDDRLGVLGGELDVNDVARLPLHQRGDLPAIEESLQPNADTRAGSLRAKKQTVGAAGELHSTLKSQASPGEGKVRLRPRHPPPDGACAPSTKPFGSSWAACAASNSDGASEVGKAVVQKCQRGTYLGRPVARRQHHGMDLVLSGQGMAWQHGL